MPFRPLRSGSLVPLVLLSAVLAVASGVAVMRARSSPAVLEQVRDARPARAHAARFSVAVAHRPCTALPAAGEATVAREACGDAGHPPPALAELAAMDESADPDSLHASALAALLWWDPAEGAADRAVASLARAARLSPRPAPLLVDLSAAHLARAERTDNPRDLVAALEHAALALEEEPGNQAALFNRALALQAMGIDGQARRAWDDYLAADSASAWAEEARRRRAALDRPAPPDTPTVATPEAEVRAFAEADPQAARLYGMDDVLGEWGAAFGDGDAAGAARHLALARTLGLALERRGGDRSLADAVRAIDAADVAAKRRLAAAHRAYAQGHERYHAHDHEAAGALFARAGRVGVAAPALALAWSAETFRAGSMVYQRRFADAIARADSVLARVDTVRHPAVAARARWVRGSARLRDDGGRESQQFFRDAARLFARAGEREYAGFMRSMDAEAAYLHGDTLGAYRTIHRSVQEMRAFRSSNWLHNSLMVLAHWATIDGMPRAAAAIQEEDFAVAAGSDQPVAAVEALLGRARVRETAGDLATAAVDLTHAEARLELIPDSAARADQRAAAALTRAILAEGDDALAGLDDAVAYFTAYDRPQWRLLARMRRADVRLARGDAKGAAADLDALTARLRGLSDRLHEASLRAAVVAQARARFDQLVMLHVRARRPVAALRALERGRISLAPVAQEDEQDAAAPVFASPGHVAIEYALIGDTLLTWTVRGREVQLLRRTVNRAALRRTVARVDAAMEAGASADDELARLYDLLIRPLRPRLGPPGTPLVLLPDGEVAGIPFPALRDTAAGRYLLEDHPLRSSPTLADAAPAPPDARDERPALLVADPAFDRAEHPTLDGLAGARAEVEALRAIHPAIVLRDTAATREALTAHARTAGMIHYAGHAVFDDARPERSYLVLAGEGASGRLTAGEVNEMELDSVRLVVLSSCRTLRSREGRSGGFAGFAGALLAAGAGGVVGSGWEVDDQATRTLMTAFHRTWRRTGDPAAALREAQLRMLRADDPALRAPAAWAGFRYVGRG